jgi:hypothetical protein
MYTFVNPMIIICSIDLTDTMALLKMATDRRGEEFSIAQMHKEGGTNNDPSAVSQARDRLCFIPLRVRGKRLCGCGGSTAGD